ncbi:hypothetical protein Tco_1439280 [Tanacetum coccineum]
MAPKQMTQAAIAKLVSDEVAKALAEDRAPMTWRCRSTWQRVSAGNAGGPERAQQARDCTFSSFMKCGPTQFHGKEGAIELCRWFEKMECTFGISECAERNKVKFAAATLQGRAYTPVNLKLPLSSLSEQTGKHRYDMKKMMLEEFCPKKKYQGSFKMFPKSKAYSEYVIRLMLAPRSTKVRHSTEPAKVHGIRKLPGSPNLGGSLF